MGFARDDIENHQHATRELTLPARQVCAAVILFLIALVSTNATTMAAPPIPVATEFDPDPAAVTRQGPAWRYPQAGWHVVHVEGGPYDRGFQHGKLLAAEIVDYIQALAAIRSHAAPHEAWRDVRKLTNALFLRRFDAEYLEEMKGIADGAASAGAKFDDRRIDLVDIVTLNSEIELEFLDHGLEASATGLDHTRFKAPQYSQPKATPKDHCSAFVATGPATRDGRIVVGHITMSNIAYVRHYNVWLDVQPEIGRRVVMQTYPGGIYSGLDYYINSGGLIVTETTIRQTKFNPAGKSLASRTRQAVQYADSIDQAVAILGDSSNGLYTNQWLLADIKSNEIAMFELGTDRTRLWRSSKNEWFGGTTGFYWGCNNSRDLEVLKETVPDLAGKPANLVYYPRLRDKAWLALFGKYSGKVDEAFAFEAYSSPPLAAFPSCDAKFTTSVMAERLESWALFGPPLGRTWDPTPDDRKKYPDVRPLVANDWTVLRVKAPGATSPSANPVDLAPFPTEKRELHVKFHAQHPFAWRGTLLPKSDKDIWLAAGFAEYEKVVSLEKAIALESREQHENSEPGNSEREKSERVKSEPGESKAKKSKADERDARDLVDLALFEHESKWLTAARRLGRDVPLAETAAETASSNWYDIAKGKGVLLLAALRTRLGADVFDRLMDEFGQAHAGHEVATQEFVNYFEKQAGAPASETFKVWLTAPAGSSAARTSDNPWTIYSFEAEHELALIVYGTAQDRAAQKEAAEHLQRALARRFGNYSIPIKSDADATEAELSERHVLLVGRPATNKAAARCCEKLPVSFAAGSFSVRGETYANASSAVIAAGDNPLNSRFSVVVYAGLGAEATWKCVQHHDPEHLPQPQVLLLPAGRKPARFRVVSKPATVAMP